jgi:hypothetical protein
MPLRFYRRFRARPFRMNLSKAGVSYSVGRKGAWLTMGHDRVRASVGLPGSGIGWYSQRRATAAIRNSAVSVVLAPAWMDRGWGDRRRLCRRRADDLVALTRHFPRLRSWLY